MTACCSACVPWPRRMHAGARLHAYAMHARGLVDAVTGTQRRHHVQLEMTSPFQIYPVQVHACKATPSKQNPHTAGDACMDVWHACRPVANRTISDEWIEGQRTSLCPQTVRSLIWIHGYRHRIGQLACQGPLACMQRETSRAPFSTMGIMPVLQREIELHAVCNM